MSLARDRIIADPAEVVRRAPDIVFGSWCGKKFRPEHVAARPGWSAIPAVRDGELHEIKSPIILQPGPAALFDGLDALHRVIARRQLLIGARNTRILHFFPEDRHPQLHMDLSLNLKGVVAQQLIPTPDGKSRRVAMEVMLGTPLVQDYLRKGEIHKLKDVIKESTNLGMKTFDQSLFELYQAGEISYEDALRHADSANEVRLKIKLAQGGDAHTLSQGMDGVELVET